MNYQRTEAEEYLTLTEVCNLLKVHPNTLRNWDKNGTLKADRIGIKRLRRYKRKDIEAFINNSDKDNNQ